jgi:hypothetical protein
MSWRKKDPGIDPDDPGLRGIGQRCQADGCGGESDRLIILHFCGFDEEG